MSRVPMRFGTEKYLEYLNDMATAIYYDRQIPYEDDPVKEAQYGTRLWKSESEHDPWELLAAAVISHAAKDYVQAVATGYKRGAEDSRRFFQTNGFLEDVLSEIDRMIWNTRSQLELERMAKRMRLIW